MTFAGRVGRLGRHFHRATNCNYPSLREVSHPSHPSQTYSYKGFSWDGLGTGGTGSLKNRRAGHEHRMRLLRKPRQER